MLLQEAIDRGYRLEPIDVECNMCGVRHKKWSITLFGELVSIQPTQSDALDRLVVLCTEN